MAEQDWRSIFGEYHPDTGFSGTEPEKDYRPGYSREDYSDAHYEPAGESTIPPRYYTPHQKPSREGRPRHTKRTESRTAGLLCAVLAAGIIGGLGGAGLSAYLLSDRVGILESRLADYEFAVQEAQEAAAESERLYSLTDADDSNAATLTPSEIYEQAIRQSVGIRTEVTMTNFFGMTSSAAVSGSGLIISENGYILTNYHVVEDAYRGQFTVQVVMYDGKEYSASIVGVEPANDIAVLKIETDSLNPVRFGNSDLLRVGDMIYAVGNPLGELEFSLSTGYVSALDREISTQENESINMFQIDAAVNEGNSGGPVYASDGSVVGIVTAKYSSSGVEGLGFAIPINDARKIADDLITKGYVTGKAFMGVSFDNRYNSMYSQYYGMPLGAYVAEVNPGSAADQAGLRAGDIITAIGEYQVGGYEELKTVLKHFSAFENTELAVYRNGAEMQLPITFDEARPDNG